MTDQTNQLPSLFAAVDLRDGRLTTDTLKVAKFFDKNHYDVHRDVKKILSIENGLTSEFSLRNFAESDWTNTRGKKYPMHDLTFNGFMLLTMSYTGAKALRIKEAYIAEFDRMRTELEQIKDAALQTVQDKLFARFGHWETARSALQNADTSAAAIDRAQGWGTGRTARAKKSMSAWGLISPQARNEMDRAHRQYAGRMAAIGRRDAQRQMSLIDTAMNPGATA